jgi:hypothetical protein
MLFNDWMSMGLRHLPDDLRYSLASYRNVGVLRFQSGVPSSHQLFYGTDRTHHEWCARLRPSFHRLHHPQW